MDGAPDDVLVLVMDFVQRALPLVCVSRRFAELWAAHHHHLSLRRLACPPAQPLWLWAHGPPWPAPPPATARARALVLRVRLWGGDVARLVTGSAGPALLRLALVSTPGTPVNEGAWLALCAALPRTLRCLELRVAQGYLSDTAFAALGAAMGGRLPALVHATVAVPMNNVTLAGLRAFLDGAERAACLTQLDLDVSGNLIRGVEYGAELARVARLPRLRVLSLTFGGWAVRKQFGLQALADLRHAHGLRSLSLAVVGARMTCDFFKKAVAGLVRLPGLERLTLDLARCDVGEQCHRALSLLRSAPVLRHLTLSLGAPAERLLLALGALRHMPCLRRLDLTIDHRWHDLGPGHVAALEFLADVPGVFLCIHHARLTPDVEMRLRRGRFAHLVVTN
jgi:hypothetical protein